MSTKEFTAKSAQEAIQLGLAQMDLGLDEVDIEIVREGSSGIFGIGARKAIVKITPIDDDDFNTASTAGTKHESYETKSNNFSDALENTAEIIENKAEEIFTKANEKLDGKPKEFIEKAGRKIDELGDKAEEKLNPLIDKAGEKLNELSQRTRAAGEAFVKPVNKDNKEYRGEKKKEKEVDPLVESPEHVKFLQEFLDGLFTKMGVECTYKMAQFGETIQIDLKSEDTGRIIGHRGETLDSIQYVTRLAIHKTDLPYRSIVVQTENYREKREQTLRALAKRLGTKVERTGKKVVLEPMKPYERRIIHDTLQSNPNVTTGSEGVEPNRHVVIMPK